MNAPESREESIFNGALLLPPSERAAYLKSVCGGDDALRERVQALLDQNDNSQGALERPPAEPPRKTIVFSLPPTEKPGDRIGNYKLLQQIGEGGCGVVYMAEQEQPVRRRVALKVIKLGMDTRDVIARFEAERQALALMDHPNIAKVFDAGATQTGRPYFVMELVRGIKITDYCDQHSLNTTQRVELFSQVCRAIQHAHQKGIIHRDIKPSNILVTLHDGVPVPKVIDFGIAKATDQRLTDKTLFTQFEQFIGTPAYMSPEQAEMSGLDIDTRSDIYSLGVLLYELLTSRTPFDPKELMADGLDAMRKAIREKDPPRPSTRLSTMMMNDLTTVARLRHSEPPKLVHLIKGDLDWIVMKALEKDRTRRYESASGFALDLQRYLENEPVLARPPSQVYRFQKLVRRNKLLVGAICSVSAAIVLGLAVSTWLLFKEREAHRKANLAAVRSEQVARFLEEMLKGVGPQVARGRDTALLQEILSSTVARMTKELQDQPEVEAELCNTIGEVYRALGQYSKAETMHRGAQALQDNAGPAQKLALATSLSDLALVMRDQGRLAEAEALQRQSLALRSKVLSRGHADVAISMNNLALVLRSEGKFAEAESLHREALQMQRKIFGSQHLAVATSLNNLALVLCDEGRPDEAEPAFRQALAIQRNFLGDQAATIALTLDNLAFVLREQGRLSEAEALDKEALEMQRKLVGNEHKDVATVLNNLALIYVLQGRLADAESLDREALAMRRKIFGNDHPEVAVSLDNLALVLSDTGRSKEGESLEREALAIRSKSLGDAHPAVAGSLNNLGLILRDQGRLPEAEACFHDAVARERKSLGDGHSSTISSVHNLVDVLLAQHKYDQVEQLFTSMLASDSRSQGPALEVLRVRGDTRARTARWQEAVADLNKVLEQSPTNRPAYHSLSVVLAQTGDAPAYSRCCAGELARFGGTDDPFVANQIVSDCLLLPPTNLLTQGRLPEITIASSTNHEAIPAFALNRGLLEYRLGHFESAADWLRRSLNDPAVNVAAARSCEACEYLVLAMVQHRLNRATQARESLAKGLDIVDKNGPRPEGGDLGRNWREWTTARILAREAKTLMPGGWAMNTESK